MKIAILTLPLHTNYGGILQNYALQTVLKQMGHDVITYNVQLQSLNFSLKLKSVIVLIVKKIIFGEKGPVRKWKRKGEDELIRINTNKFIKENISLTREINSARELYKFSSTNTFDCIIVGSDQCWRQLYTPFCVSNYFLSFLKNEKTLRLSYATSFGIDKWEFSDKLTNQCTELIKKFDSVTVREDSAVILCEKYLGIKADLMIDPTMLLTKKHYFSFFEDNEKGTTESYIYYYILDMNESKSQIVKCVAENLGIKKVFSVTPKDEFKNVGGKRINECIYPKVSDWLKGFANAKFVVTDSFHGTVFSILFNVPFIVIGNEERGVSRIDSLLKLFGLRNRMLIGDQKPSPLLLNTCIDFDSINGIIEMERNKSFDFFKKKLGNE